MPPGHTKFIRVNGRPVLLANRKGRIYALHGICPHQNNPLEGATIWDHLIDCPWHHFQFDVRTGENYYPSNVYPRDVKKQVRPLRTFPVQVKEGEVWVDLE